MKPLDFPSPAVVALLADYNRIIRNITRYGRFSEKIDFGDYMAFGKVWYGAKYSHRVWEQFAHTFEK